jgi:hypothetical protein
VHGLASRDGGGDQRLLHSVQLLQLPLHGGNARQSLGHRQGVIGHPLDLGHDEAEHAVGEQGGEQASGSQVCSAMYPVGVWAPGHTMLRRSGAAWAEAEALIRALAQTPSASR